ncbi:centrosomal protein CEP57L1 isoform X2 [Pseudophryne corroboree]|uniref:centrosomal protein CEP57L1 isoform X2 n=1 Tax=Pseudophryne corroboree TaxID=495146 RepID=UPI003081A076
MDSAVRDSYLASLCPPPYTASIADPVEAKSLSSRKSSSSSKDQNPHCYDVLQAPNSKALVSALKTLQEKISRIQLEKSKAQNRITSLSMETAEHKMEKSDDVRQKTDVITQLNAAQQRCSLLEKQLSYMRHMVQTAEMEKKTVHEQQTLLQQENIQDKLEKLSLLEKECLRLTATQQIAESKIDQLEEKLYAEEQQRKLMQEKAIQLETGLEVNRIFLSASAQNASQKKVKKKKQLQSLSATLTLCARPSLGTGSLSASPPCDSPTLSCQDTKPAINKGIPKHGIPLKAGDLPFVAGKSTSSSHSLSATIQNVLHMMKHQSQTPRGTLQRSRSAGHKPIRPSGANRTSATCSVPSTGDSLSDLLLALQGELEQMSFEHEDLLKQINETKDSDMREDLEREMDCLVRHMETKSDQIQKLKRHQANVFRLKKAAQSMKKLSSSARLAVAGEGSKVDVLATPKRKPETLPRGAQTPNSKTSLQLLKNVQKIQTTLKKDDIMWEK